MLLGALVVAFVPRTVPFASIALLATLESTMIRGPTFVACMTAITIGARSTVACSIVESFAGALVGRSFRLGLRSARLIGRWCLWE